MTLAVQSNILVCSWSIPLCHQATFRTELCLPVNNVVSPPNSTQSWFSNDDYNFLFRQFVVCKGLLKYAMHTWNILDDCGNHNKPILQYMRIRSCQGKKALEEQRASMSNSCHAWNSLEKRYLYDRIRMEQTLMQKSVEDDTWQYHVNHEILGLLPSPKPCLVEGIASHHEELSDMPLDGMA